MKTSGVLRLAHTGQEFASNVRSWTTIIKRDLPKESHFAQRKQNASELAALLGAAIEAQVAVADMLMMTKEILQWAIPVYGFEFAQQVHDMAHEEQCTKCDGCALAGMILALKTAQVDTCAKEEE